MPFWHVLLPKAGGPNSFSTFCSSACSLNCLRVSACTRKQSTIQCWMIFAARRRLCIAAAGGGRWQVGGRRRGWRRSGRRGGSTSASFCLAIIAGDIDPLQQSKRVTFCGAHSHYASGTREPHLFRLRLFDGDDNCFMLVAVADAFPMLLRSASFWVSCADHTALQRSAVGAAQLLAGMPRCGAAPNPGCTLSQPVTPRPR